MDSYLEMFYRFHETEDNPTYEPSRALSLEELLFGPDSPTEIIPVAVFNFDDNLDSEVSEVA